MATGLWRHSPSSWLWTTGSVTHLSDEHLSLLSQVPTEDEVTKHLRTSKVRAPLGLIFYKELWPVVWEDVLAVICEFAQGNRGFGHLNHYLLFIISKRTLSAQIEGFRPIAISNAIYLIVFRVLANQLLEVLLELIHSVRSAVINDKSIIDSSTIALDIVAHWQR